MIISKFYSVAGQLMGMPTIQESGYATSDDSTLNDLRKFENEDLQIVRVRRRRGLVAKSMTGAEIKTDTLSDEMLGRFENVIQLGRTQTVFAAPKQPFGPLNGKEVIQYKRLWLQLQK